MAKKPTKSAKPRRTKTETRNLEILAACFRPTTTTLELEISSDLEPEASTSKGYMVVTGRDNHGGKDSQMVGFIMYPGLTFTEAQKVLKLVYRKLPRCVGRDGVPRNSAKDRALEYWFNAYHHQNRNDRIIESLEFRAWLKNPSKPRPKRPPSKKRVANCAALALVLGVSRETVDKAYHRWKVSQGIKTRTYTTAKLDVR